MGEQAVYTLEVRRSPISSLSPALRQEAVKRHGPHPVINVLGGLARHNFRDADLPAFVDPKKTKKCECWVVWAGIAAAHDDSCGRHGGTGALKTPDWGTPPACRTSAAERTD